MRISVHDRSRYISKKNRKQKQQRYLSTDTDLLSPHAVSFIHLSRFEDGRLQWARTCTVTMKEWRFREFVRFVDCFCCCVILFYSSSSSQHCLVAMTCDRCSVSNVQRSLISMSLRIITGYHDPRSHLQSGLFTSVGINKFSIGLLERLQAHTQATLDVEKMNKQNWNM